MNTQRNFYSMHEVSCAKVTLSLYGKKDRFGDEMVDIFHVLWAARVILWFKNYLSKVREFITALKTTWNSAVSKVWSLIRGNSLSLPDVP